MSVKKIGRTTMLALSLLLLLCLLATALFVFISAMRGKTAFVGDRACLWIVTDSMAPLIPAESYIVVKKADPADIEAGDVIVFYSQDPAIADRPETHRVTAVIGDHEAFITRGDNNLKVDEDAVPADRLLGVFERRLNGLSLLGRVLASRIGLLLITAFSLLILSGLTLPYLSRLVKDKQAEQEEMHRAEIEARIAAEVARLQAQGDRNARDKH